MESAVNQQCCAVTGANGYVGSCISNVLQQEGMQVVRLQRKVEDRPNARPFSLEKGLDVAVLEQCDALVHCAWDFSAHSWRQMRAINVDGSVRLFRRAKAAGVKRLVFISTMSAYVGCRSLYGKAKLEVETQVAPLGAHIVRPGLVYGDSPGGMVGALATMAMLPVLPLVGSGRQLMYLVHEDDLGYLVLGLCRGAISPQQEPVVAANPKPRTLREILQILAARQHHGIVFLPLPWQPAWLGLRLLELLGLRCRLRSDGLIGLLYVDPSPNFEATYQTHMTFRDFVQ